MTLALERGSLQVCPDLNEEFSVRQGRLGAALAQRPWPHGVGGLSGALQGPTDGIPIVVGSERPVVVGQACRAYGAG